jgi:hypothetical protein
MEKLLDCSAFISRSGKENGSSRALLLQRDTA